MTFQPNNHTVSNHVIHHMLNLKLLNTNITDTKTHIIFFRFMNSILFGFLQTNDKVLLGQIFGLNIM